MCLCARSAIFWRSCWSCSLQPGWQGTHLSKREPTRQLALGINMAPSASLWPTVHVNVCHAQVSCDLAESTDWLNVIEECRWKRIDCKLVAMYPWASTGRGCPWVRKKRLNVSRIFFDAMKGRNSISRRRKCLRDGSAPWITSVVSWAISWLCSQNCSPTWGSSET